MQPKIKLRLHVFLRFQPLNSTINAQKRQKNQVDTHFLCVHLTCASRTILIQKFQVDEIALRWTKFRFNGRKRHSLDEISFFINI
jgi:hypothetical protein